MKERIIAYIRNKKESTDKRTQDVFLNLLGMFFLKGASILVGLLLVPMTIHYVDVEDYGIWLTISSVVAWVSFFDIGINNGFRNKFAEARAKGDDLLAQKYVSTTYGLLFLIFIPLILLFLLVNPFVDWGKVFNLTNEVANQLQTVMAIVFAHFGLKFILSTINIVFLANQKPVMQSLSLFCEQLLSLGVIFFVTQFTSGSLLNLSIALCVPPILVLLVVSIVAFSNKYKSFRPQIKMIDFSLNRQLFGLGLQFFVIQVAGLIQYQAANFIIISNFGGKEVTMYNIAYKYFFIVSMVMNILLAPLWSAVTDAYVKDDILWIKKQVKKYLYVAIGLSLVLVLMFFSCNFFYKLWLGRDYIEIPSAISFSCMLFSVSTLFTGLFISIINGIGKLKLQFYLCFVTPFLFLLFVFIFIRYLNLGVEALPISSLIANISGFIIAPIQYYKLIIKGKNGIWDR